MGKFCENNFRKFPLSSKLSNPAFPVDLHLESQASHPQQAPMTPAHFFLPAPSHVCSSPGRSPSPGSSAAAGELLAISILLLGKEVTLGPSLLLSSWPSWETHQECCLFASPSLKCGWIGPRVPARFQLLQGRSGLKHHQAWVKVPDTAWSGGKHCRCPIQQAAKQGIL